jgi:hypothetical protein
MPLALSEVIVEGLRAAAPFYACYQYGIFRSGMTTRSVMLPVGTFTSDDVGEPSVRAYRWRFLPLAQGETHGVAVAGTSIGFHAPHQPRLDFAFLYESYGTGFGLIMVNNPYYSVFVPQRQGKVGLDMLLAMRLLQNQSSVLQLLDVPARNGRYVAPDKVHFERHRLEFAPMDHYKHATVTPAGGDGSKVMGVGRLSWPAADKEHHPVPDEDWAVITHEPSAWPAYLRPVGHLLSGVHNVIRKLCDNHAWMRMDVPYTESHQLHKELAELTELDKEFYMSEANLAPQKLQLEEVSRAMQGAHHKV